MPALQQVYYVKPDPERGIHGRSCESCGHDICWCYVVKLDDGGTMTLGSDCVASLLDPTAGQLLKKYANAAAREWLKKVPAPRDGESRAEYINRRIAEKTNARRAWQHWKALATDGGYGWRSQRFTAEQRLTNRGVTNPKGRKSHYYHCHTYQCRTCAEAIAAVPAYDQAVRDELSTMLREIEDACHANRFDFVDKPAWRI